MCSLSGSQLQLSQRAFESAQSISQDVQSIILSQDSNEKNRGDSLASDVCLACGDIAFHLGHVYLKQGKPQSAIEEGQRALELYTQGSGEDTSSRMRHTFALIALAFGTMGNVTEAEQALSNIEKQSMGPIDGK